MDEVGVRGPFIWGGEEGWGVVMREDETTINTKKSTILLLDYLLCSLNFSILGSVLLGAPQQGSSSIHNVGTYRLR